MKAAIGLGSNLGNRRAHLERALHRLRECGQLLAVSAIIETDPCGGPAQGRYLNAAAILETDLSPAELHARMAAIEAEAGRARIVKNGPRTLDLDVLLFEHESVQRPELTVPHPRMAERRFVLGPLAEIAPDWRVPGFDKSVGELLEDLQDDR